MATHFDNLESEVPPSLGRPGRLKPVDPSVDTFRQRFAPFSSDPVGDQIEEQMRTPPARIAPPGTRERFGDPTKVLAGATPQGEAKSFDMPGLSREPPKAPADGFDIPELTHEPPQTSKLQRFLKNVTPEGPISGIIGLARTAGEAAQGQRPDLMTNPENAIPEAVQGGVPATGPRPALGGGIEGIARGATRPRPPEPPVPPPARDYASELAAARLEAKRVAQGMRDSGTMPPESSGPTIELPGPVTKPPESQLLPAQVVKETRAVLKGMELKDRLNPNSPSNLTARQQALEAAIRPHLREIEAVGKRTDAPMAALEAAVPSLSEAVSTPGKAASVANWVRVYERAARAKFSEQAKASLGLATKNLNNNLGLDLTLDDFLKGP